jgi:phage shock protein PspC (stress-responsive transcriptional regulator)
MLTRSESNRVIAGVAGAIGQRLGVDPTLVRLAFVLSAFFGGFGILTYVVLWIALPTGTAHAAPARIAEERYARGEVTAAELERIKSNLQAAA